MRVIPKTKNEALNYLNDLFAQLQIINAELEQIDEDLLIEANEYFSIIISIYGKDPNDCQSARRTDCILSHKWHSHQIAEFLVNENQKEIY